MTAPGNPNRRAAPGPAPSAGLLAVLVLIAVPVLAASEAPRAVRAFLDFSRTGPLSTSPPGRAITTSTGRQLRIDAVASNLDTPWDLAWAPDGALWFTERPGRISRLDLATGRIERVGTLDVTERSESGLMGLAFHPDFPRQPYVYLAHSYGGARIRNRLVRMTWRSGRLTDPETLLDEIPGRGNHNGSRLAFGPDRMLYMTTGDAGSADLAQDRASTAGKVLRLTPDGRPAPGNPFGNATWSYGHRNAQGLSFASNGALYSAEHGPSEADEVNRIERGRNYGWPAVRGACDSPAERSFCSQNDVVEPIAEYTPTIGIAGLAVYEADLIAGWRNSLLVTSLRGQQLIRLQLSADGGRAVAQEMVLDGGYGRLRAVLAGPDGALYFTTSNHDGRGRPVAADDRILRIRP